MKALEELLASLRRLFDFRTRPPVEPISAPTSDRPPPAESSVPDESVLFDEPVPLDLDEPAVEDALTIDDTVTEAPAVPHDADAVAEIRALLEAMAEPPVAAPEPVTDTSPAAEPVQATVPLEPVPLDRAPSMESAGSIAAPAPLLADGALVLTLDTPPATFTIARSTATLGRGEDNTIRLDELSVSRRHARIVYRRTGYWLSDLGSMGGTWVNGSRLAAPHQLGAGDVIDIGHCRLTVSVAGVPANGDVRAKTPSRRAARR